MATDAGLQCSVSAFSAALSLNPLCSSHRHEARKAATVQALLQLATPEPMSAHNCEKADASFSNPCWHTVSELLAAVQDGCSAGQGTRQAA